MIRALAILVLSLALGLGYSALRLTSLKREHAALVVDLAAERRLRAAEQAAMIKHAATLANIRRNERKHSNELQAALAAQASWASQPVPSSIADTLRLPVSDR